MIYERIVDFDTVQISLFKQKNEKAWLPIRFFEFDGSQNECGRLFLSRFTT